MKRRRTCAGKGVICLTLLCISLATGWGRTLQDETEDGGEGGFLSKDLPLKVVVTTPSELATANGTLDVQDQQALIVVFSRSVIALGEDFGTTILPDDKVPFNLEPKVPGKFRWVTTYIARWDPDGAWPLDSNINFVWNRGLKTHDGIVLSINETTGPLTLTTPGLSMDIQDVTSEEASRLTDGKWNPFIGSESDVLPEVPFDGAIQLRFNHNVSISTLNRRLQVLNAESVREKGLKATVEPCVERPFPIFFCPTCTRAEASTVSPKSSKCANVTINGALKPATKYFLSLPEGVRYSRKAGALQTQLKTDFGGLREFKIPMSDTSVSSPFLTMQLPHGLDASVPTTENIANLKQQMTLTFEKEQVDFELSLSDKGTVLIIADLEPNKDYRLEVAASSTVLDGFGQPLMESKAKLRGAKIEDRFSAVHSDYGVSIFESGQKWGRTLFSIKQGGISQTRSSARCGIPQGQVNAFRISNNRMFLSSMAVLEDASTRSSLSQSLGDPSREILHAADNQESELIELDISKLIRVSGIMAYEYCSSWSTEHRLLMETNIQAIIMGSKAQETVVWLTSMKTGKPVSGARVFFYKNTRANYQTELRQPEDFIFRAVETTDAEGKATFDNLGDNLNMLVRDKNKKALLVGNVDVGYSSAERRPRTKLVLDRKLVKPGDDLHIKGYIMKVSEDALNWVPVGVRSGLIIVRPSLDPDSEARFDSFELAANPDFGSFEAQIPIPENAKFQEYAIYFSQNSDPFTQSYHTQFTVGDPRPPTVGLIVDAPFWAKPDSAIKVAVTAESFIGSAVGSAEMTLKWRISGNQNDDELEGESTILTDDAGEAEASIDLSSNALDAPSPTPGSTLVVDIQWIGPTRELIEETSRIRLELADLVVSLEKTVDTDFPGQGFGVKASATDLQLQPIAPQELSIELKELPENDDDGDDGPRIYRPSVAVEPLEAISTETCTTMSDSEAYDCRFSLPKFGNFALEVCAPVDDGVICRRDFLGRTEKQWQDQRPLQTHFPVGFLEITSGPYSIGDTAIFAIENPYENANAIIMWGSSLGSQHKIVPLTDRDITEVPVPVDETCTANCRVSFALSIPRQTKGLPFETDLPVSKLFDLAMPHTAYDDMSISVEQDNTFDISLTFPGIPPVDDDFVIAPGETSEIEVGLEDNPGEAEVLVVAVDKSVLELIPYPLQNVANTFLLDLSERFGFTSTSRDLIAPQAARNLIDHFFARRDLDPWFPPSFSLSSSFDVDLSEEQYIDQHKQPLRTPYTSPVSFRRSRSRSQVAGNGFASTSASSSITGEIAFSESAAADGGFALASAKSTADGAQARASPAASDSQETSSVRLLEDFVSTAVFQTVVSENGVARVNFTAPDNLGTFIVRAYAASGTGAFGEVEKDLIVRRKISLTPSAPRFARVGDVFEAGAVVTLSGSAKKRPRVTVTLELEGQSGDRLTVVDSSQQVIRMSQDGTEEIRFLIEATKVGEAAFKISADDGSGATDALVINLPVEGLQEAVSVATSFAVDGSAEAKWQEGLKLPEAVPGSGSLKIQAGVGRMPTILSLAGQLYDENPEHECPITADYALALASIPFITDPYDVFNLDTNFLDDGTVQVLAGILSNFSAGVSSLNEMTSSVLGLEHALYCPGANIRFRPTKPSLYQNARGVWILNELVTGLGGEPIEGIERTTDSLVRLQMTWRTALESVLLEDATESRKKFDGPISIYRVAIARAALGGDWNPPEGTPETIVNDLSMDRLSEESPSLSVESQAYYVLTLMAMGKGRRHPDIRKAIRSWTSNFRVGGRTAYVASGKGSPSPASNVANSLILMAMTRGNVRNPLIEKLANYVGSPPVGPYGFRIFRSHDKTISMLSLKEYDVSRGNDQPSVQLNIRSGSSSILEFLFQDNSKPVASSETLWEDLESPPRPLEFEAEGTGEVTLAASLIFVPSKLLPFPTYRGIFVQRSIRLADSNGPSLKTIPVTSVVEISVQLMTPDRLGPSTVRVLMPAGLEPIDPNVSPSDKDFCPIPFRNYFSSVRFFSCPDQETRPSVVIFSFRSMTSGTHEVSFRAVAATAGTFALPPVRAFVDDQPELMGMSSAGTLTVCSGSDCEAVADTPPKPPKTCPKDCSDNGACDLDSGTCLCLPGFKGEDCASIEST